MTDIWIRTSPSIDGSTYVVTIEFDEDRAIVLDRDLATRYATTMLAAVQRADFDAAVFAQMIQRVDLQSTAQLIQELRKDRPPLDDAATKPLRVDPGVNPKGKPFLALFLDDEQVGQWDLKDARDHATAVMEAIEAADLDAAYYRALVGIIQVEEPLARTILSRLRP